MDDDLCIHEMLPASCTICNGREKREESDGKKLSHTFTASFSGVCRGCGDVIEPGDTIGRLNNGKYVCEDCAEKARE